MTSAEVPGDAMGLQTTRTKRRLGVLTAGGDAPGLNAVLRAVVKTGALLGFDSLGIEDGFEGLVGEPRTRPLGPADVRGLVGAGGSILGCTNRGHFGDGRDAFRQAAAAVRRLELWGLIAVGGDGSHAIAARLHAEGAPVICVPKTIDNDLVGTDRAFGFDTAVAYATDAIDRLHTTAESHGRVIVVEVMGRDAGWIALEAGLAGGADVILIPEIPFQIGKAADHIKRRDAAGRRFSIVVCAEGAHPAGEEPIWQKTAPGEPRRMGGAGGRVAEELAPLCGKEIRTVVLGHLQRGGGPVASDRIIATALGSAAVRAAADGRFGHTVGYRGQGTMLVPLAEVTGRTRTVPRQHELLRAARDVGVSFAGADD